MWPWEHLAVGYLAVSLWRRLRGHRRPRDREVLAVVVGTQFPDLVDKPLAWGTSLLSAGRSLTHSLVVAVPLVVGVALVARRYGHSDAGWAFAVGYLSHLVTDVLYGPLVGSPPDWRFLLWPLVPAAGADRGSVFGAVFDLAVGFAGFLATPRGAFYLAGEAALLGTALWVWHRDGYPGLASVRAAIVRVVPT